MKAAQAGTALHYVSHARHLYTPQTGPAARADGIEAGLWTALSALQEKATMLQELARRAHQAGDHERHDRHHAAAAQADHTAALLREQLLTDDRA
jgi:two-component system chemotaxis response regulator CheB